MYIIIKKNIMEPIKNFEGYYIDRNGSIYNKNKTIKKVSIDRGGYKVAWLYKDGKRCPVLVHRLVALQYIPQTDSCVNHINGNKLDNRVENLEWCSAKYNADHRDKLHPNMYDHNKERRISVECIETGEIFDSLKDVTKRYGGSVSNLHLSIKNNGSFKGYHFKKYNKTNG